MSVQNRTRPEGARPPSARSLPGEPSLTEICALASSLHFRCHCPNSRLSEPSSLATQPPLNRSLGTLPLAPIRPLRYQNNCVALCTSPHNWVGQVRLVSLPFTPPGQVGVHLPSSESPSFDNPRFSNQGPRQARGAPLGTGKCWLPLGSHWVRKTRAAQHAVCYTPSKQVPRVLRFGNAVAPEPSLLV